MSLRFLGHVDLYEYIERVKQDTGYSDDDDFAPVAGNQQLFSWLAYVDRLDRLLVIVNPTTGGATTKPRAMLFDPLLAASGVGDALVKVDTTSHGPFAVTDPSGTQLLYACDGSTSGDWKDYDPFTLTKGSFAFWTGSDYKRPDLSIAPFAGSVVGGWSGTHRWILFPGLTDGIPGETNATGANVYPKGLALTRCSVGHVGSPIGTGLNGSNYALLWVNLANNEAVGRLQITAGRTSSSTSLFTEEPWFGHSFDWEPLQFVPDADSTPAAPKGELVLVSLKAGQPSPGSGKQNTLWIKILDFNPFGIAATGGAPERTHEKVTLRSGVDFDHDPMFGDSAFGTADSVDGRFGIVYHPPTRRFLVLLVTYNQQTNVAGKTALGYFARQPDPAMVTGPVPRGVPRTNDIAEYESFVVGSLGEPVAGQRVAWTLARNSTEDEVLSVTGGIGTTSTVAHGPIDAHFDGRAEGTLVVKADSTPLVQGTDYTVVLSTGVITWMTDQSGATLVTASYEHRSTNASPAHGTLLDSESVTDGDGKARARIRYPDDDTLVGELDRLTTALA